MLPFRCVVLNFGGVTVCLRWVPTGKLLNSCTGKVENEPTHGSNVDIPHIHACKQTLGLSAGTSFNGQKQQRINLNADAIYNAKQENLNVWLQKMLISKKPVPEWLGINPMIQPEPEDLPKDNPKLEITVLRSNGGNGNLNPIQMLNLQRQSIKKAQDLKTKTSANSDLKLSR
ncbi:hypothetical protein Tco_1337424 [Tanacetum coccineum]